MRPNARRILLIDDESDIREVAVMALQVMAGWEVQTAASGHAGVELARRTPPDAILLDVMMPDVDGPSTLRLLRSEPSSARVPIVFLTAKVQAADQKQLTALGAAGIIAKPFDPLTLADTVASILRW